MLAIVDYDKAHVFTYLQWMLNVRSNCNAGVSQATTLQTPRVSSLETVVMRFTQMRGDSSDCNEL